MHSDHAGGQWIAAAEAAAAHNGDCHRRIDALGELKELLVGPAADNAAAADQQGLAGLADHLRQGVHIGHIRLGSLEVLGGPLDQLAQMAMEAVLLQRERLVFGLFGGDILENIDEHRPGAAAAGNAEGLANDVRKLVNIPDQVVAFGDGHGDAGDVHLLKRILADEVFSHVAGDEHHGGGIQMGGGDAGDQIGAAGAGGGEADAHLAGAAGIAVGGVGCALFVGGENVLDLAGISVQRVIHIEDRAAGIAENGVNTLFQQTLDQDLRTCHLHMSVNSL